MKNTKLYKCLECGTIFSVNMNKIPYNNLMKILYSEFIEKDLYGKMRETIYESINFKEWAERFSRLIIQKLHTDLFNSKRIKYTHLFLLHNIKNFNEMFFYKYVKENKNKFLDEFLYKYADPFLHKFGDEINEK